MMIRHALLLLAMTAAAPAAAALPSPLLGRWAADLARIPGPPEAKPKSVTISFAENAAGEWTTRVDIIGPGNAERHISSTAKPGGTAVTVTGDLSDGDVAALALPAPNALIVSLAKNGVPASTRIYTVAPGSKVMIETASYVGADGKPVARTVRFNRIP